MTRPAYTATDVGAIIAAILTAACDAVAMFAPQLMPVDRSTRDTIIVMMSGLLGTIAVSFMTARAIKHAAQLAALSRVNPASTAHDVLVRGLVAERQPTRKAA
jgi:hypothetical protein